MARAERGDDRPAVLLVDDDELMHRLLAATLRGGPCRLLQARTGAEGLRLAREERPALVLLDLRLGADNGLRVCRRLRAEDETRATRIVVLSGQDDPVTRVRARRAGADGFFAKPFSPLAIWRVVDELTAS
jgi:DNA-binding response OmpR family regulator